MGQGVTINYNKAIKEMLDFKKVFDDINPKLSRKLIGELGEYYVMKKLKSKGFKRITHKGGQSGYDILVYDNGAKIEVRTSLLKNEGLFPKGIDFYGWRVRNRDQKHDNKFEYLVAVALDDSFKKPKFYIFSYKEAYSVEDVSIGRFKNVQKKIAIYEDNDTMKMAIKAKPELVPKYEKYVNRHQEKFIDKWSKLRKRIK